MTGLRRRSGTLRDRMFMTTAVAALVALWLLLPSQASAEGPNAILTPTGYNANAIARGDDTSNLVVNLPFSMNWNGTTYTQLYINMNGNCTFGSAFSGYNPTTTLAATTRSIMAPFWADVDTRNTATGQVTYSTTAAGSVPQVNGRPAFFVNWINVASYNTQATPMNSFQLVIVDRSDTGAGNFDFMFNYDKVTWDIANSASSIRARAGWGRAGTGFELPGSGVAQSSASALLDTASASTALTQNYLNSTGQLGRYVWQVRSGAAPNSAPVVTVTNRTLEGNASGGYAGYTGTGDAAATDSDGTVVSLVNDRPAFLPLGTTSVTWTATDDLGAQTTAVQSILVMDTTAPVNPTLTSPSHVVGMWSTDRSVTMDSAGASDVCAGISGFSYEWFPVSPGTPDVVSDASIATTVTTTTTTTVDTQSFATATWPTGWTRSNTTYVRLTNTTGRTRGTYAAEAWANSTARRTVDFYRDYDLSAVSSASLQFWDNVSTLAGTNDYVRVAYSVNGGSTYTQLQELTALSGWTSRTYSLPAGGTVRVRFSASVNSSSEYANWDDITVQGFTTSTQVVRTTHSVTTLQDGSWYFGLRTTDAAGNWSSTTSAGPYLIDTIPPVTTDNAPTGWSRLPVSVTLTPNDAGLVTSTRYRIGAGAWSDYVSPIAVSQNGASNIQYYSVDAAGHVEQTRSTTARVDAVAPPPPDTLTASADSTSSIALEWSETVDEHSGLSHYEVVRNGVVIDTVVESEYSDTDLEGGSTYSYVVRAVDVAGNISADSPVAEETIPLNAFYLTVQVPTVTLAPVDPGSRVSLPAAASVSIGGIGLVEFDLYCSGEDFQRVAPSPGPTIPIGALAYVTTGNVSLAERAFTTTLALLDSGTGTASEWQRDYTFDLSLDAAWEADPGTYTTTVTYTVVAR